MTVDVPKPKRGDGVGSSLVVRAVELKPLLPAPTYPDAFTHAVTATSGSVAIGANNTAPIVNVNAGWNSTINVNVERQVARELPSYLSSVVAKFSQASLSEYNSGPMRELPPEVNVKIAHNNFPPGHLILADFNKYCHILEASYRGVEQSNDDARRLVRRRAAYVYQEQLHSLCTQNGISSGQLHAFVRTNAVTLVNAVIGVLLDEFAADGTVKVLRETAHLAICLVVADAVIECEVLERP